MQKSTQNIIKKLTYLVFTGLFMMLAISAKMHRDHQVVQDVTIRIDHTSGNFFITEDDVQEAMSAMIPESGRLMKTDDLKQLEDRLSEIAQVDRANAFVNHAGELSVEVYQRKPMYRVIRKDNSSYYVDRQGYKFPVSGKYTARCPVITGYIADNGATSGKISASNSLDLFELANAIVDHPLWSAQFGQVYVNQQGEYELIPRTGGHTVLLGNATNLEEKLSKLEIFYKEGLKKAGWDTYKVINVKYKDQVVCTK